MEFDSVRLTMDRCEKIGKKEKEEISQKLDEIETVCTSAPSLRKNGTGSDPMWYGSAERA